MISYHIVIPSSQQMTQQNNKYVKYFHSLRKSLQSFPMAEIFL